MQAEVSVMVRVIIMGVYFILERQKINAFLWLLDMADFCGCFRFLSNASLGCSVSLAFSLQRELGLVSGKRARVRCPSTYPIAVGQQRDSNGALPEADR